MTRLQAGEYRLLPGVTPTRLLKQIAAGQVVQYSFTIIEGWTARDLLAALANEPRLERQLAPDLGYPELAERVGIDGSPEGWFLPETYAFTRGSTDLDLLKRAHLAAQHTLAQAWSGRAGSIAVETPYEALILASIIEKETALDHERWDISGVFHRRLQKRMRLQTDPTVIYGLGDRYDGDIKYRDLREDTPYNTYVHHGLPPTPIALPSARSIEAAVNPASGEALYFVATGDGGHHFSATLEEHNAAVRKYIRGE